MSEQAGTKKWTQDRNEPPTCARCGDEYSLRDGMKPSKYCDPCAQESISGMEPLFRELHKFTKGFSGRKIDKLNRRAESFLASLERGN